MTETQTPEAGERVSDAEITAAIAELQVQNNLARPGVRVYGIAISALCELRSRRSTDTRTEVRAAALEEAAKVADSLIPNYERGGWGHAALEQAARHIRALSQSPPPTRASDGEADTETRRLR